VAAQRVHLPEPVLRGDEALGEEEVVERGGAEMRNTVGIALDRNGCGEAGESDRSVELRERVVQGLVGPVAGVVETGDCAQDDQSDEREQGTADDLAATRLMRCFLGREGLVGNDVGVCEMGKAHVLMASVNGGTG